MGSWLLSLFTALFIVIVITPVVIKVSKLKHLVDDPKEDRKVHKRSVPTVGGIAIFAAFLFSVSLWAGWDNIAVSIPDYQFYQYFVASLLILFFIGLKDDLVGISPLKKLIAMLLVGVIMVFFAKMRISSMEGIFGIYAFPAWFSVILSLFTYIVVVNSVNLIDGLDGLAGGSGVIAGIAFGLWFYAADNHFFAVVGFALAGALLGFLLFNFQPARIFMGDSGSLIVGFVLCVLAMKMINYPDLYLPQSLKNVSKPVLAMTILSYPLVDTIRVFMLRAIKGTSPFTADKNHIHHRLLAKGYSHKKSSVILYCFSISLLVVCYFTKELNPTMAFVAMLIASFIGVQGLFLLKSKTHQR